MQAQTLTWELLEDVLLIVHSPTAPDPLEWSEFIASCYKLGRVERSLVLSPDEVLSAVQRKEVAKLVAKLKTQKVAVLTASRMGQTVVTGLGWITGIHRGFLPSQWQDLVKFLGVEKALAEALLIRSSVLAAKVGNPVLSGVAKAG